MAIGTATTSSSTTTVEAAAPIPAANVSQTSSGISPAAIYRNDASGVVSDHRHEHLESADPLDPLAPDQSQKSVAIGSGFVADAAGHVYTNAHVVLGASSVKVTFRTNANEPGTTYNAKVLGADKATDVAVLQVEGRRRASSIRSRWGACARSTSATRSSRSATRSASRAASPRASSRRSARHD